MSLLMNSGHVGTGATGPSRLEKQGSPRAPRTRGRLEIWIDADWKEPGVLRLAELGVVRKIRRDE